MHLPLAFAKDLFETTQANDTTVVITQSKSRPADSPPPIEQLIGIAAAATSNAPADDGVLWQPEKSKEGSVAIVICGADKRMEILRGGVLIGQAPISFADSSASLPEALFVKLQPVPGKPDWSTVLVAGSQESAAAQPLAGLQLPPAFRTELKEFLVPGTLVITTPSPLSPANRSPTDFVGIQASNPATANQ